MDRTEGSHLYLGQTVSREGRRVCGRTVRRLRARMRAAVREGASPKELRRLELAIASLVPTLVW